MKHGLTALVAANFWYLPGQLGFSPHSACRFIVCVCISQSQSIILLLLSPVSRHAKTICVYVIKFTSTSCLKEGTICQFNQFFRTLAWNLDCEKRLILFTQSFTASTCNVTFNWAALSDRGSPLYRTLVFKPNKSQTVWIPIRNLLCAVTLHSTAYFSLPFHC
jgi:hypothetical protein